jgi:hypothetical protein
MTDYLNPRGVFGTGVSAVGVMLATEAISVPFQLPPRLVALGICGLIALVVFSKKFQLEPIERVVMWVLVALALFQSAWGSNQIVATAKDVVIAEAHAQEEPTPPRRPGDPWRGP